MKDNKRRWHLYNCCFLSWMRVCVPYLLLLFFVAKRKKKGTNIFIIILPAPTWKWREAMRCTYCIVNVRTIPTFHPRKNRLRKIASQSRLIMNMRWIDNLIQAKADFFSYLYRGFFKNKKIHRSKTICSRNHLFRWLESKSVFQNTYEKSLIKIPLM